MATSRPAACSSCMAASLSSGVQPPSTSRDAGLLRRSRAPRRRGRPRAAARRSALRLQRRPRRPRSSRRSSASTKLATQPGLVGRVDLRGLAPPAAPHRRSAAEPRRRRAPVRHRRSGWRSCSTPSRPCPACSVSLRPAAQPGGAGAASATHAPAPAPRGAATAPPVRRASSTASPGRTPLAAVHPVEPRRVARERAGLVEDHGVDRRPAPRAPAGSCTTTPPRASDPALASIAAGVASDSAQGHVTISTATATINAWPGPTATTRHPRQRSRGQYRDEEGPRHPVGQLREARLAERRRFPSGHDLREARGAAHARRCAPARPRPRL